MRRLDRTYKDLQSENRRFRERVKFYEKKEDESKQLKQQREAARQERNNLSKKLRKG